MELWRVMFCPAKGGNRERADGSGGVEGKKQM